MNVEEQINPYINSQAEPKRNDIQALHQLALQDFTSKQDRNFDF